MKIKLIEFNFLTCLSLMLSCGNGFNRLLKFNSTENWNSFDFNVSHPVSEDEEDNNHFTQRYIWNISYAPYQVKCPPVNLVRVAGQV